MTDEVIALGGLVLIRPRMEILFLAEIILLTSTLIFVGCTSADSPTAPFPDLTREVITGKPTVEQIVMNEGESTAVTVGFEKPLKFDAFINFEIQGGIGRFLKPMGVIEVKKGAADFSLTMDSYVNDLIEGTQTIQLVFTSETLTEPVQIPIQIVDPTAPAIIALTNENPLQLPTAAVNVGSSAEIIITNNGDVAATKIQIAGLNSVFHFLGGTYPGTGGNCGALLKPKEICKIKIEGTMSAPGVEQLLIQLSYFDGSQSQQLSMNLKLACDSVVSVLSGLPDSLSASKFLNVIVSGFQITQYKFKVASSTVMTCSDPAGYSSTGVSVGTYITSGIASEPDGQMRLCVLGFNGTSNQWQSPDSATFYTWIKDTEPPGNPQIVINNSNVSTNQMDVSLALSALGAQFMYVTNVAGCNSGGSWELYNESKTWTLNTADTDNSVYVKYRDRLGNETACMSDSILHDQTSPAVTIEQEISQPDPTLSLPIVYNLTLSEAMNEDFIVTINSVIQQKGTATGVTWAMQKIDATHFKLQVIQVLQGGTIIPEIAANQIKDLAGNWNLASATSTDRTVTYNIVEFYLRDLFLGEDSTCAQASDFKTYCWGNNDYGQLGINTTGTFEKVPKLLPMASPLPSSFKKIAVGFDSTCGITYDSKAYCWGNCADGKTAQRIDQTTYCSTSNNSPQIIKFMDFVPNPDIFAGASTDQFLDITVGSAHACALTKSAGVYCWGKSSEGQHGNGRIPVGIDNYVYEYQYPIVANVGGGQLDFKVLASGDNHTCALAADGKIWCWGRNAEGQLGNNSTALSSTSVLVITSDFTDFDAFTQVSAGANHTCGVDSRGRAFCWGENTHGQLGNNTDVSSLKPVLVNTDSLTKAVAFVEVKAGRSHTCARTAQGEIYCWGESANGQLGAPYANVDKWTPMGVQASGSLINNAVQLEVGGSHTCYITSESKLFCWGSNNKGQLGNNSLSSSQLPVAIDFGSYLSPRSNKQISAGGSNTCSLNQKGQILCWGNGAEGRNGSGTSNYEIPTLTVTTGVSAGQYFTQMSTGGEHACGITADGKAYCWGKNAEGQVGNSNTSNQGSPVAVTITGINPFLGFTKIRTGQSHTCALHADGVIYCWGYGFFGQLGRNSQTSAVSPVAVQTTALTSRFIDLSSGALHNCGVTAQGLAYCWGSGISGRLGNNSITDKWIPSAVQANSFQSRSKVRSVAAGGGHSCAILTGDGGGWCWGTGDHGQLGNSGNLSKQTPVQVSYTANSGVFVEMELGDSHTCAVNHRFELMCWGAGLLGRIGDGVFLDRNSPSSIDFTPSDTSLPQHPLFKGAFTISGGDTHTCVTGLNGDSYCWGQSFYGRLGLQGQLYDAGTPLKVSDP
jgi:alpha-tubulin suppressor-like RCC1 family protein